MSETSRLRWPYPNQFEDPWYDSFASFTDAVDASVYTTREDRSSVLMSTATVAYNISGTAGVVTWDAPIELLSPVAGFLLSVSAGSATLADGDVLYMQLVRAPVANQTLSFNVARSVPNTDDCILIAVRRGTTVYWRNGKVINNGESLVLFATGGGGGGGGAFIKQDGTNSPTADISWAGNRLMDLGAPVAGTDAVNKNYVDSASSGVVWESGDTWATVYGKANTQRPCVIAIPSDGASRHITTGTVDLTDIEFRGITRLASGELPVIVVDNGAVLGSALHLRRVAMHFACTSSAAMSPTTKLDITLHEARFANDATATVPPLAIPASVAGLWIRLFENSLIGDYNASGVAVIELATSGNINLLVLTHSALFTRTARTVGAPATFVALLDSSADLTAPSTLGAGITPTVTLLSLAQAESFTPNTPSNWSGGTNNVAGALNQVVTQLRQVNAGTGLTGGGALSSNLSLSVVFGVTGGTAAEGNDSRILNATPNTRSISGTYPIAIDGGFTPVDLSADRTISMVIAGSTQGDLLFYDGFQWTRLSTGVDGQVLQTRGAGNTPIYVDQRIQRAGVCALRTTNALSGAPLLVSTFYYDPAEWQDIGTRSLYFEAVLSVDSVPYTATVKVYNRTTGGYVLLNVGSALTNNTTSPTRIVSDAIIAPVTNFDPTQAAMLQFELFVDNAAGNAILGYAQIVVK